MGEKKSDLSNEDLMVLYQNGDSDAFECLYRRHSGRVFQYLKTKVSEQAAQDILQETFAKVHRARYQYASQYPFLPWLFTISRNALTDFFKASETKIALNSRDVEIDSLAAIDIGVTSEHDLSLALDSLPAGQRRAIELRYLNDWTFEKIAEELQTTPENSRQIVSRGIKQIRSFFKGERK